MSVAVSVIIPTFNRARLLGEAIESCLRQDVAGLEVVVVDDASADATGAVLERYGDRVVTIRLQDRAGVDEARNSGMNAARGEFLKFLDSDDVLVDGALAQELRIARERRADIVVSGWGEVHLDTRDDEIPGTRREFAAPTMEPVVDAVLAGRAVPTGAALYRSAYVGGMRWEADVYNLDDWDWFCRAALRDGRIVSSTSGIAYWWRHHPAPRITDGSLRENAVAHHRVLEKIEAMLTQRRELSCDRARRLAQYYYKELRVLKRFDSERFERALRHIFELDPEFRPVDEEYSATIRLLSRALGVRRTLALYGAAKAVEARVRGGA
ncbi:MAG: glycosyltransferase family 2 protein [Candidatus Binatia bacterium]|jgi:glycosyltransferase involved in cell wall biosynthesis